MEMNYLAILVAALVPILLGFLWYNPILFGNAWMTEAGMTEEKMKGGNMAIIFGVSIVLSLLLSAFLQTLVIHQIGATQLIGGDPTADGILPSYQAFMNDYGTNFRTFKHGALHGLLAGLFIVLPIIAINGLFERKSAKYIFINSGYWTVALTIMGAILCGWD
jgi:UDP-N-acetylmuramyl pentapeptide phosphotransferase/UDP-N-acetylglucosamine-1-phosphate transferase